MSEKILDKIISTIDDSISSFNKSIPAAQRKMLDEVLLLVKELDISSDGTIKNNVTNLKIIGRIRGKLEEAVLNKKYLKDVQKFARSFDEIASLQNAYFKSLEKSFKPDSLMQEISKQAISWKIGRAHV